MNNLPCKVQKIVSRYDAERAMTRAYLNRFNWTFSFRRDSEVVWTYGNWSKEPITVPVPGKPEKVSLMTQVFCAAHDELCKILMVMVPLYMGTLRPTRGGGSNFPRRRI